MTHTQKAELEFEAWWTHTGHGIIRQAGLYPSAEVLKALCRVAYFQGRIDEDCKLEAQLWEANIQRKKKMETEVL